MKKNFKLPTIIGVLVLIFGMFAGIYLINSKQVFKLGATSSTIPNNVRISNITDNSITVTWTTDLETSGFIKWGIGQNSLNKVLSSQNTTKSTVHSETIQNLSPNSNVYFSINSEGVDYDNNGIVWQSRTIASKINSTQSIKGSGIVLLPDSVTPAKAIVYLSTNGVILSALTSEEGSWVIPISNYIENISNDTIIEITINGGLNGTSQATIYPTVVETTPAMILGKTYDFRTLTASNDSTVPKSSLTVPEAVNVASRFEITRSTAVATGTVIIESVKEGEIINTVDPEFFGKAPQNSNLEILVESELQTENITADTNGKWSWSPPKNLEPGEHKVTVKWTDATGILRTITRSFIVQAAEGPAFESSPSATPKVSSSPTATSISSPTASSSATARPVPETGSLTPTLGLFIMGIGVFLSSIYIWNKANLE